MSKTSFAGHTPYDPNDIAMNPACEKP